MSDNDSRPDYTPTAEILLQDASGPDSSMIVPTLLHFPFWGAQSLGDAETPSNYHLYPFPIVPTASLTASSPEDIHDISRRTSYATVTSAVSSLPTVVTPDLPSVSSEVVDYAPSTKRPRAIIDDYHNYDYFSDAEYASRPEMESVAFYECATGTTLRAGSAPSIVAATNPADCIPTYVGHDGANHSQQDVRAYKRARSNEYCPTSSKVDCMSWNSQETCLIHEAPHIERLGTTAGTKGLREATLPPSDSNDSLLTIQPSRTSSPFETRSLRARATSPAISIRPPLDDAGVLLDDDDLASSDGLYDGDATDHTREEQNSVLATVTQWQSSRMPHDDGFVHHTYALTRTMSSSAVTGIDKFNTDPPTNAQNRSLNKHMSAVRSGTSKDTMVFDSDPLPSVMLSLPGQSMFAIAPSFSEVDADDIFTLPASANTQRSAPPPSDFAGENTEVQPRKQQLKSSRDIYTPLWVRGSGQHKEGFCDLCTPGKWLQLKNSAFW